MSADNLVASQPDILEVIANLSSDAVFTPPRVVNAVLDALSPLGISDLSMPFTPERVWRAIRDAEKGVGGRNHDHDAV